MGLVFFAEEVYCAAFSFPLFPKITISIPHYLPGSNVLSRGNLVLVAFFAGKWYDKSYENRMIRRPNHEKGFDCTSGTAADGSNSSTNALAAELAFTQQRLSSHVSDHSALQHRAVVVRLAAAAAASTSTAVQLLRRELQHSKQLLLQLIRTSLKARVTSGWIEVQDSGASTGCRRHHRVARPGPL